MKNILIIAGLLSIASPAFASTDKYVDGCTKLSEVAGTVESARQYGSTQDDLLASVHKTNGAPDVIAILEIVVKGAFAIPLQDSYPAKLKAIELYKQSTFEWCIQATQKAG